MRDSATPDAIWLIALAGVGFFLPFTTVTIFGAPRGAFVAIHLLITGAATILWARQYRENPLDLRYRPLAGAMVGAAAASFMVNFVMGQPPNEGPFGWTLAWELFWLGGVYAVLDVLLLTILPVMVVWHMAVRMRWDQTVIHWIAVSALALVASMTVTAAYHAGFPEFQGAAISQPLIGNIAVSVAFIVTRSPIAPLIAHVSLHVASVLHAIQTSIPLPPHY
jgi:hypothetical protein